MKWLIVVVGIVLIVSLFGFLGFMILSDTSDEERISEDSLPELPYNEISCEESGGVWEHTSSGVGVVIIKTVSSCNLPTSDAGKACTNSDQCESYCEAGECHDFVEIFQRICDRTPPQKVGGRYEWICNEDGHSIF
jgi:hypothetical protein